MLTAEPASGFVDPVFDSQAVFRTVLHALAHPGTIGEMPIALDPPAPLDPATAAVCLALLDVETPIWLQARGDAVPGFLRFHCGSPIVASPGGARFALIDDLPAMPLLQAFDAGTDEYPDRSATLIVQVEDLIAGSGVTLTGPGMREQSRLTVRGLSSSFWDEWRENAANFPRGIDIIFTAGRRLAALPRTTRVEV